MQPSSLLSGLEKRYPPEVSARIIAALRQDDLVWSALQDEDFCQRIFETDQGKPQFWAPPNLALILLGGDLKSEELSTSPMPTIDPSLRQQAVRIFEDVSKRGGRPATLREAGLLALALRERRRMTGNWSGLASELMYNPVDGKMISSRT
jgi:hypothetical protein